MSLCVERRHHRWSGLRDCLAADLRRYLTKSPHDLARGNNWRTRLSASFSPEVSPVIWHRVAHLLYANGWHTAALILARLNQLVHKVSITPQSCVGSGLRLPHPAGVTFHGTAGDELTLYSLAVCCSLPEEWGGMPDTGPRLGHYVTVAAHAIVQGPISVGSGSTVGHGIPLRHNAPAAVLVYSRAMLLRFRPLATEIAAHPAEANP